MRPLAEARDALLVVEPGGSVDAEAKPHFVCLEEIAPSIIDEEAIGLNDVTCSAVCWNMLADDREGGFIIIDRQDERLSGVPDDLNLIANEWRFEDEPASRLKCLDRHPPPVASCWQIAISAVNIAVGRGLQHELPDAKRRWIDRARLVFLRLHEDAPAVSLKWPPKRHVTSGRPSVFVLPSWMKSCVTPM